MPTMLFVTLALGAHKLARVHVRLYAILSWHAFFTKHSVC